MDAPRGSIVAYSTGPGQVAADGDGRNSPYTLALSRAMQTPGVPAEKMFKVVRDSVIADTNGDQTPWEESSLTGADFYFNPAPLAATYIFTMRRGGLNTLRASAEHELSFRAGHHVLPRSEPGPSFPVSEKQQTSRWVPIARST